MPLFHQEFPIILFWNPKCGCTSLIKWFYYQVGHLENANEFSEWIHQYREQVFEAQPNYKLHLRNHLLANKKEVYKLVRNPYKRAISSYFAALAVPEIMSQIAPGVTNGLSFKQFLFAIRRIGVGRRSINSHIAMQYIHGEEYFVHHYMKLEDFESEIRKMEQKYNLLHSPLEELSKSHHHASNIMNESLKGSFADINMINSILTNSELPSYENFYDMETMQLVRNIYRKDFSMFGYSPLQII
jgi:hypothetical protein